jgi:hypothetical protein
MFDRYETVEISGAETKMRGDAQKVKGSNGRN